MRFRLDGEGILLPPVTFQKKNFITPMKVGTEVEASSSYARPPTDTTSPTPSYLGAPSDLGGPGMEEDESSLQRLYEREEEEQDEFGGAE